MKICSEFFLLQFVFSFAAVPFVLGDDLEEVVYSKSPQIVRSSVDVSSSGNVYFVFPPAMLTVSGKGNTILVKAGAEVRISGERNLIYGDERSKIRVTGSQNNFFIVGKSSVEDTGSENKFRSVTGFKVVKRDIPVEPGVKKSGGRESKLDGAKVVDKSAKSLPTAVAAVGNYKSKTEKSTMKGAIVPRDDLQVHVPVEVVGKVPGKNNFVSENPDRMKEVISPDILAGGGSILRKEVMALKSFKGPTADNGEWAAAMASAKKIAPSVHSLFTILPSAQTLQVSDLPKSSKSDIIRHWKIESIKTSDSMLKLLGLNMQGKMTFFEDGSGLLDATMGIKGLDLERNAVFTWNADTVGKLLVNPGTEEESEWNYKALPDGDLEAEVKTEDGVVLTLLLKPFAE